MLIDLKRKFVFAANSKCASTSVERALARHCAIRITRTPDGKHMPLADILGNFAFLGLDGFFKWGIVRDPVDWTRSWYNFRSRPELRASNRRTYAGDMTFEEFVDSLVSGRPKPPANIGDQRSYFCAPDGALLADCLIAQEALDAELPVVLERLGFERNVMVDRRNTSKPSVQAGTIDAATRTRLETHFERDYELIRNRPTP